MLGELQLAFVQVLLGQNYAGFEQWKALVLMLSSCDEALQQSPELAADLVEVLYYQLHDVPADFFIDPLSKDNFLQLALSNLHEIATPSGTPSPDPAGHLERLTKQLAQLRNSVYNKFGWDIVIPWEGGLEDDEGPTVVEL